MHRYRTKMHKELHKERQRDPNSVYNFKNKPTTNINMEEWQRSGGIEISVSEENVTDADKMGEKGSSKAEGEVIAGEKETQFADYQIKILEASFKLSAYPTDDDVKSLSKTLNLNFYIIRRWFKNARKGWHMYEHNVTEEDSRCQKTSRGYNYQCDMCMLVFDWFFELVEHRKSCYKLSRHEGHTVESESVDAEHSEATRFTELQEKVLGDSFKCSAHPDDATVENLSKSLGLSEAAIKTWFQNSREKAIVHTDGENSGATDFTEFQEDVLMDFFKRSAYPDGATVENLSRSLNLNEDLIYNWFQNTRREAIKNHDNSNLDLYVPEKEARFQRMAYGCNYKCKWCLQVFDWYPNLVEHFKKQHAVVKISAALRAAVEDSPAAAGEGKKDFMFRCNECNISFKWYVIIGVS